MPKFRYRRPEVQGVQWNGGDDTHSVLCSMAARMGLGVDEVCLGPLNSFCFVKPKQDVRQQCEAQEEDWVMCDGENMWVLTEEEHRQLFCEVLQ
jgi:hypothetical protein